MTDTTPLLRAQNIDKAFGGVPALRGASLEVARGEVHALVGENGAGKSTLIKVVTGVHRGDGGSIEFEGAPLELKSPQQAQDRGISTIYQEINLVPMRSVAENVFLGREPRRLGLVDWKRMNAQARTVLDRLGLEVDVTRPLGSLDVAIQQMVAIARAVSYDARLVIMDEPTSSLDEKEVETLFEVVRQLKRDGVSTIFISHRLDELYAVCDRVTIMRDGETVRTSADGRDLEARADRRHARQGPRRGAPVRRDRVRRGDARGLRGLHRGPPRGPRAQAPRRDARGRVGRDRRARRAARLGADGGRAHARGRRRAGVGRDPRRRVRDPLHPPEGRHRGADRLLLGGPQDVRHRAPHVGARQHDARAAAGAEPSRDRRPRGAGRDRGPLHRSPRHQDRRAGPADRRAVWRQPAEGAARPRARARAAAADRRRADARDRRRREGRDPAPHQRARRRGPRGPDDLLRARGDHRGRGPRRGDARRPLRRRARRATRSRRTRS